MYEGIVDPVDLSEHVVDEQWAERNFKIREFYVARAENQYVGTASYQNLGNFAYIGYFYIKNQFHGKGYGRGLMQFLELRAMTDHLPQLTLFANPKSLWAVKFYERLGFTVKTGDKKEILEMENGIFKLFYEQNSLLLEKTVPTPKPLDFSGTMDTVEIN
jgi:GNAT superfamily N-acetyltransferase